MTPKKFISWKAGKNICSFCGADIGWNPTNVTLHENECLSVQNSMGIRPDPPKNKIDQEKIIVYPNGLSGFFEED